MELELPVDMGPNGGTLLRHKRWPLKNLASFTVVSRDRLRFHVQIEHKWEEWANLHTWHAWIVDSEGRRFDPERIEGGTPQHVVTMWDYEVRSARRNHFGDIVYVNNDGYKDRRPLGSLSVFRGKGDFVFYARDIFTPEIRWITLVVERRGVAFAFTWKFAEVAPESDIAHARAWRGSDGPESARLAHEPSAVGLR
jgi:hypothetical protein